jgi:hypothetical protein
VTVWDWVFVGAGLAVAALAAIGYFAFGVFRAVKDLSKEIGRAGTVLAEASAPMQSGTARPRSGDGSRPGSAPTGR